MIEVRIVVMCVCWGGKFIEDSVWNRLMGIFQTMYHSLGCSYICVHICKNAEWYTNDYCTFWSPIAVQ